MLESHAWSTRLMVKILEQFQFSNDFQDQLNELEESFSVRLNSCFFAEAEPQNQGSCLFWVLGSNGARNLRSVQLPHHLSLWISGSEE